MKQYDSFLMSLSIPAVNINWLKNCLTCSQYLKPNRFAINVVKSSTSRQNASKKIEEQLAQLRQADSHINRVLGSNEIYESKWSYFEECIFSFFGLHNKIEEILKGFIDAGNGFYVDQILPETTHIIVNEYTELDLKKLNKFAEPKLVSIFWLKDCLLYQRKVKEDDYLVQPVPAVENNLFQRTLSQPSSNSARLAFSRRNTMSSFGNSSFEEQPSLGYHSNR